MNRVFIDSIPLALEFPNKDYQRFEKRVNNIGDFFLYLYDVNSNLFKKIFLIGLFIWRSIQLSMLLASQGKYNNACLSKELINTS
jgi:hypothetical protein